MTEIKMKIALMEAIDNAIVDEVFSNEYYWWEKEIERMADAALAVHLASREWQKAAKENS